MGYELIYSPKSKAKLQQIYDWIVSKSGSPQLAKKYLTELTDFCDVLAAFPYRGVSRDGIRKGLRTIGFRKKIIIAFRVKASSVIIEDFYFAKQNYINAITFE